MLSRILLHTLESVFLPPKFIVDLLEELARLLAHFEHPARWETQHLGYSSHLVVLGRAGEQRQPEEQFHNNASKRPHINCSGVW